MTRAFLGALVSALLGGCWIASVSGPDAAAIPTGPPRAMGSEAVGPITVVGSGRAEGVGWRYSVYESTDGLCAQLEFASGASAGCGDPLPATDATFGGVGMSGGTGGVMAFEGMVSGAVGTLFLETEDGKRYLAALMPLTEAGYAAQAYVIFLPAGAAPDRLVAEDGEGKSLGTYDVSTRGP